MALIVINREESFLAENKEEEREGHLQNKSNFGAAITNFMPPNIDGFKAKGSGYSYKLKVHKLSSAKKLHHFAKIFPQNFLMKWCH